MVSAPPSSPPPPLLPATSPAPPSTRDLAGRVRTAPPADLPALLREIVATPASDARNRALAAALSRWLEGDPAAFRTFLDELAAADPADDAFILRFYAALADALPLLSERAAASPYLAELLSHFVRHQMTSDPVAGLRWAEQWLLGDALEIARVEAVTALAETDPRAALRELARIQSPLRRLEAIDALGEAYARVDTDAALAWGRSLPLAAERAMAMDGILVALAEDDPPRAAADFQAFAGELNAAYQAHVAAERAARPASAVDDAGGEAAPPENSPDLELLQDSSPSIAHALAAEDPAAAIRWVESLPDSVAKTDSLRAALGAWAETDPAAALRYQRQNLPHDPAAVGQIFSSWAAQAPETAAAEASRVPGLTQRQRALESTVEGWLATGATAETVARWGGGLSDSADRDLVHRTLAATIDSAAPDQAWRYASAVSDPAARASVLRSAFVNLAAESPRRAAEELRRASSLTAAERVRLEEVLASMR